MSNALAIRDAERPIVYVIQAETGGPVKVGRTTLGRLSDRLAEIQTGHPERLRILTTIPGASGAERGLHIGLAEHRLHGEWFAPECIPTIEYYHAVVHGSVDARALPRSTDVTNEEYADRLWRKALRCMRRGALMHRVGVRLAELAESIREAPRPADDDGLL